MYTGKERINLDKDFLTKLGIEDETAETILSEIGRSEEALFTDLSKEAKDLRITLAAKNEGVRDEELLKLLIGNSPDIEGSVKSAKKTHGWLFGENQTPTFSCKTGGAAKKASPFAHGAGLN